MGPAGFAMDSPPRRSFSFAGCAWCVPYHFGVAATLHDRGLLGNARFVGASSGALVAAAMACGLDPVACFDATLRAAEPWLRHPLGPAGAMSEIVKTALEDMLPVDAHERAYGRFWASVTTLPSLSSRLVPDRPLKAREELIAVVLASCYVPLYYERAASLAGRICLDGGLRNNQPRLDAHTLTISPFGSPLTRADITPRKPLSLFRAFKPTRASLAGAFEAGRRDGAAHLDACSKQN